VLLLALARCALRYGGQSRIGHARDQISVVLERAWSTKQIALYLIARFLCEKRESSFGFHALGQDWHFKPVSKLR
jgi:hypothetical protein